GSGRFVIPEDLLRTSDIADRTAGRNDERRFTPTRRSSDLLIIAILIAIAIPTFLGAQNRARDRGAQSNLRNALTAAKTIATDNSGQFDKVDIAALTAAEGSLSFVATTPTGKQIAVDGGKVS